MRNTLTYALLALLVFVLAACDTNNSRNGNNPDTDPVVEYALYAATGPLTYVASDGTESTGIATQARLVASEAITTDTTFELAILDATGEPVGSTYELTLERGSTRADTFRPFVDFTYAPGEYAVVVSLDGEEVARSEHELTAAAGLPAPEAITAVADLDEIVVSFDAVTAHYIGVGVVNRTAMTLLATETWGAHVTSASLPYDESFELTADANYTVSMQLQEERLATGSNVESIDTRFALVSSLPLDLQERQEAFLNVVSALAPGGAQDYLLIGGVAAPFGVHPIVDAYEGAHYLTSAYMHLYDAIPYLRGDRRVLSTIPRGFRLIGNEFEHEGQTLIFEVYGGGESWHTSFAVPETNATLEDVPGEITFGFAGEQMTLTWDPVPGATHYLLLAEGFSSMHMETLTDTSLTLTTSAMFEVDPELEYGVLLVALDGDPLLPPSRVLKGSYNVTAYSPE